MINEPYAAAESAAPARVDKLYGQIWRPALLALHKTIRDALPPEKRKGFLPRDAGFFAPLLDIDQNRGFVCGALSDSGRFEGLCVVRLYGSAHDARADGALTAPALAPAGGRLAVLQSLGVLPTSQGKKLSRVLIARAIELVADEGAIHCFAQVAQDNVCSWSQFLAQGFTIQSSWTSGHGRHLLYRATRPVLSPPATLMMEKPKDFAPAAFSVWPEPSL